MEGYLQKVLQRIGWEGGSLVNSSSEGQRRLYVGVSPQGSATIARSAPIGTSFPLMVEPTRLVYPGCKHSLPENSFLLAANGILHRGNRSSVTVFPHIWSHSLQDAILAVAQQEAATLMQLQKSSGNIEIAGDILCKDRGDKGAWNVVFSVCKDSTAKKFSSLPSCGQKRKCENEQPQGMVHIGEFHTHPPAPNAHTCKPPSHYDIFQLLIACHLGHHNYVMTICKEGLYAVSAQQHAVQRVMEDVKAYYRLPIHETQMSELEIQEQNQDCRMPVVERIPKHLTALHGVLIGLHDTYYRLLVENQTQRNLQGFITQYIRAVHRIGVNVEYYSTHKFPWKVASRAQMQRETPFASRSKRMKRQ